MTLRRREPTCVITGVKIKKRLARAGSPPPSEELEEVKTMKVAPDLIFVQVSILRN